MSLQNFDFIDFGASKGGSIDFGRKTLGGKNGIGVDIDPKKIELMSQSGYNCFHGDITKLDIQDGAFRFSVMSHILEHLPSMDLATQAIETAIRISRDFVYIQGPNFDDDDYLKKYGMKFYWSTWRGHPLHFKSTHLETILHNLGVSTYHIFGSDKIESSKSNCIHPLNSPDNQHEYSKDKHPPKEVLLFDRPVFRELVAVIPLSENVPLKRIKFVKKYLELGQQNQKLSLLSRIFKKSTPVQQNGDNHCSLCTKADDMLRQVNFKHQTSLQ